MLGHFKPIKMILTLSSFADFGLVSLIFPSQGSVPPLPLTTPLDGNGWVFGGDVVRVEGSGGLTDHN